MRPILIEVVSMMFTSFGHCIRCQPVFEESGVTRETRREDALEYPPELMEEGMRLSEWLGELRRLYQHRIAIRFIDAHSPLGIIKSLKHRFRTYPTFIVESKDVYTGWDREELEKLLDNHIAAAARGEPERSGKRAPR